MNSFERSEFYRLKHDLSSLRAAILLERALTRDGYILEPSDRVWIRDASGMLIIVTCITVPCDGDEAIFATEGESVRVPLRDCYREQGNVQETGK